LLYDEDLIAERRACAAACPLVYNISLISSVKSPSGQEYFFASVAGLGQDCTFSLHFLLRVPLLMTGPLPIRLHYF
jgi:hypothetical protein